MASYLIDGILLIALVVTALRSGRMHRELKLLRESAPDFGEAMAETDRTITRAAEAVVSLKHEGVQTAQSLEARSAEANAVADRLEGLITRAEWHAAGRARAPASGDRATSATERSSSTGRRPHASLAG